ncbi:MAG: RNA methyltransferase [Acidipropionibacterium sp.]|jgi:TrmH family RNA methyltransferase|nr:RNA methyltransferase [Acidipropionibacterium sp.]
MIREPITSTSNPTAKKARRIFQTPGAHSPVVACEGIQVVTQLLATEIARGATVLFDDEALRSHPVMADLERFESNGGVLVPATSQVLNHITSKDGRTEIVALFDKPADQPLRACDLASGDESAQSVALVAPSNPGNLGSIMRTLVATGCRTLILVEGGVSPWNAQTIKASMGACFSLAIRTAPSVGSLAAITTDSGIPLIAASGHHATPGRPPRAPRVVWLFGPEGRGLSLDQVALADSVAALPMSDRVDSLNLSVAVGVFTYSWLFDAE